MESDLERRDSYTFFNRGLDRIRRNASDQSLSQDDVNTTIQKRKVNCKNDNLVYLVI
jgi:hypothetical protein